MAGSRHKRVPFDQRIESMPALRRIDGPRQLHCAQHIGLELDAGMLELAAQKAVIEPRVVSNKQPAFKTGQQIMRNGLERRRVAHHRIADAGELLDKEWNRLLRIDERTPLRHAGRPNLDHTDFSDAIYAEGAARRFEIDENQWF